MRVAQQMGCSLKTIAKRLNGKIIGDETLLIHGVAAIEDAQAGEISFVTHPKYEKKAASTLASALMTQKVFEGISKTFLIVEDPYFCFAKLLAFFNPPKRMPTGIDPSAHIGERVSLGEDVSIGPTVTIEDGAVIGDHVQIGAGSFIGAGSQVGPGTQVYPNVTIREGVKIGREVIIHSGTVIGSDGFGFAFHKGKYHKIPQVGGVIIEDDVELGANVTIDRGALGQTIIGRGTKLDNLVHVGHNVKIGNDTILVAQVGISGSVTIGHHVTLAGQAGVVGHLTIGDHVVAAAKTGVSKDVPSGEHISGFPHFSHKEWLKSQAVLRHLPNLQHQVRSLNTQISEMEKEIKTLKDEKENTS